MNRLLLALALCLATLAGPAAAQGGYTTEKHDTHGLRFSRPRSYLAIPTPPSEQWVVLRYAEEKERSERAGRKVSPEIHVVRIDYVPDPAPATGQGSAAGDGEKGEQEGVKEGEEEAQAPEMPLNSFERYLERELEGWTAAELQRGKERGDWAATVYELSPPKKRRQMAGWAYVWRKEREKTVCVLGFCAEEDREAESRIWEHMAKGMKFFEPVTPENTREHLKWQRFYGRRDYVDPEYRIQVRLALADGWEAEDTENYIVIYSTDDQPLVRRVVSDLEDIREEYERLFPPAGPIEAVSTVRICRDRDEYLKFGGASRSAGYWNPVEEELVLYDATVREKGKPTDKTDTFIVLYHEAFHQYIHYSVGELAPHSWFNEGYGDFFSGAQISRGKVRRIGPNPWRVNTIRRAVEREEHVSFEDIVRYEQLAYYAKASLCYAQGWSMVYFLETSPTVQRNEAWSRILPTYFDELKTAWSEERATLEEAGQDSDPASVVLAQQQARVRAIDKSTDGIDLAELEREWKAFVLELEPVER